MALNFKAITVLLLCCAVGGYFLYTTGRNRKEVNVSKETAKSLLTLHGRRALGRTNLGQQQQEQQQQPQQQQQQRWELEQQQQRDRQQQLQQQQQQQSQQQPEQQPQENQNRGKQQAATTLPTTIATTTRPVFKTTTRPVFNTTTRPPLRMATAPRGNRTTVTSLNRGRWNKTMGGVKQRLNYKRNRPVPMTPDNATYFSMMPKWIRQCEKFYLDIGSGAGLTVKRLINPSKYRGNRLTKYHEEKFGSEIQTYGKKEFFSSHLCVLGFEPRSGLYRKLMQLENDYRWMGYQVHFFNFAVSDKDEHIRVPIVSSKQRFVPLTMMKHPYISVGGLKTKSAKLSGIITKVLKAKPISMIRINIGGDEFKVLNDLLSQGLLCSDRIELILVQLRNLGVAKQPNQNDNAAKKAEFDDFMKRVGEQTCKPTKIKEFNEKTFALRSRDGETLVQRLGPNGPKRGGLNAMGKTRLGGAFNGGVPQNPAGGENANVNLNANVGDKRGVNREGRMREGRMREGGMRAGRIARQDNQRMGREGVLGRQTNRDRRAAA